VGSHLERPFQGTPRGVPIAPRHVQRAKVFERHGKGRIFGGEEGFLGPQGAETGIKAAGISYLSSEAERFRKEIEGFGDGEGARAVELLVGGQEFRRTPLGLLVAACTQVASNCLRGKFLRGVRLGWD
jgi:hypothetical protein